MKRIHLVATTLVVALALLTSLAPTSGAAQTKQKPRVRLYKVELVNPHGAQPFSPPVWATHSRRFDLVTVGRPANYGVKEVAENANGDPLVFALGLDVNGIFRSGIASGGAASGEGPVLPGETRTWQVRTRRGERLFSMVAMVGCTNDGLILADSARLPKRVGARKVFPLAAYDAGTERNTEDLDDMMPPCSMGDTGVFTSNSALAENGVVRFHPGIAGGNDLDPAIWGWDDPIARLRVTRMR